MLCVPNFNEFVVFFLLGYSPACEFCVSTFRNTVSSIFIGGVNIFLFTPPMKTALTQCSETSAHKIQTAENYPKERIQHSTQ